MCIAGRTRIVHAQISLRPSSDCLGPPLSAYKITEYCEMELRIAKTMIGRTSLSRLNLDGRHISRKCIFWMSRAFFIEGHFIAYIRLSYREFSAREGRNMRKRTFWYVRLTKTQIRITKTRLFKYLENFTSKNWKFYNKKGSDIFHISAQNIDCGYSLEPPRRGGSNEYPQSMFSSRNKKK